MLQVFLNGGRQVLLAGDLYLFHHNLTFSFLPGIHPRCYVLLYGLRIKYLMGVLHNHHLKYNEMIVLPAALLYYCELPSQFPYELPSYLYLWIIISMQSNEHEVMLLGFPYLIIGNSSIYVIDIIGTHPVSIDFLHLYNFQSWYRVWQIYLLSILLPVGFLVAILIPIHIFVFSPVGVFVPLHYDVLVGVALPWWSHVTHLPCYFLL